MLTAHLEGCNVDIAYIDSGAPESVDYTTLVCIHGNTYHAQTFQRLLPLAARANIRLIALNRRDYVGSTPLRDDELAALMSTDDSKHRQFLYNRGLEVARFLLWVVKNLGIPPVCNSGKKGGLALLGWSLGNITSLAFLANLQTYPREVTDMLQSYLRHFFIYEAVFSFLGLVSPEDAYHPLWDDEIPVDGKVAAIDDWFTSYFTHPYFDHSSNTQARDLASLQLRTPSNPARPPTSANRTPDDLAATVDAAPAMRSEIAFYVKVQDTTLFHQYKASLTSGRKSGSAKLPLPNLKVSVINGTHTVWSIIWASWKIEEDMKRWKAEGMTVRPIEFITTEGSNHFVLWDEPELLMRTLASCLVEKPVAKDWRSGSCVVA